MCSVYVGPVYVCMFVCVCETGQNKEQLRPISLDSTRVFVNEMKSAGASMSVQHAAPHSGVGCTARG